MSAAIKIDVRAFERAIRDRVDLLGKDAAKELNKRAGNVAMRAAGFTRKASKGRIMADLWKLHGGKAGKFVEGMRIFKNQYGTWSAKASRKNLTAGGARPTIYKLINYYRRHGKMAGKRKTPKWLENLGTGPGLTGAAMSMARMKFENRAMASIGYIAAGWIKVATDFGRVSKHKVSHLGLAGQSKGTLARPGSLIATLENYATGAAVVSKPALDAAMEVETKDMVDHMQSVLLKKWQRQK